MAFTLKTSPKTNTKAAQADEDEFAGLWINPGIETENEDGTTHFNRLPRGIAVSDLKDHKVYASTHERNPEWAAEATLVNQIMDMIRRKGAELAEGESVPINLSVQLYRRQEQVEAAPAAVDSNLEAQLFG